MPRQISVNITYKDEVGKVTEPLPKQARLSAIQKKYNLFWGARGPGKTAWLAFEGITNALEVPHNYVLFGRFDLDEFKKSVLPKIEMLLPENTVLSHNRQDREIKLINGSIIGYTFLDESQRILSKLRGPSIGAICVDQIEEVSENVFLGLKGTLRKPGSRQAIYATANPVKNWIYKRWIQKILDENENPDDYVEIGATPDENPYLSTEYLNILKSYPKAWRRRYYEASWDDPGGIVYPFVNERPFVIPDEEIKYLDTPERYEFVDYGVRVTVFLWATRIEDGKILIYREFWSEDNTVEHNAEVVKTLRGEEKILGSFCCPSAFERESDKRTPAEKYGEHGIGLYDARIHWRTRYPLVLKLFTDRQVVIAESCKHLIDELNRYSWPDVPIEDPKSEQPDKKNMHAVEALERGLGHIAQGKMPDVQTFQEKDEREMLGRKAWSKYYPGVIWEEIQRKPTYMELY